MQFSSQQSPLVMGILNLTPDSFSDGGKHNTLQNALRRVDEMEQKGVDIIDIGGESTGPNSQDVKLEEEISRVIPILKEIRRQTKLPISIDTYKSNLAHMALEEGADMINDVTAFRGDSKLAIVVSKHQCPVIIMYSKNSGPRTDVQKKTYQDVIKTIHNFFQDQIAFAKTQGIKSENIIIDPGMGQFISDIPRYSYEIIARLEELKKLKHKILIGLSRKSFLGGSLEERDSKCLPLTAIAHLNGADIIRTHDVKGVKDFFNSFNK